MITFNPIIRIGQQKIKKNFGEKSEKYMAYGYEKPIIRSGKYNIYIHKEFQRHR